jgi:hypothetical protein
MEDQVSRTAEVGALNAIGQNSSDGSLLDSQTVTWEGILDDQETVTIRFWLQVANEALPQEVHALPSTVYFQEGRCGR